MTCGGHLRRRKSRSTSRGGPGAVVTNLESGSAGDERGEGKGYGASGVNPFYSAPCPWGDLDSGADDHQAVERDCRCNRGKDRGVAEGNYSSLCLGRRIRSLASDCDGARIAEGGSRRGLRRDMTIRARAFAGDGLGRTW